VHRQAEAPNPDLFFVSFADGEDLVRNLNAAWRSNDDRLGCWRFSPRSPRAFLLRAVTGPAIPPLELLAETYGDGSGHPNGTAWFMLSDKSASAKAECVRYLAQLEALMNLTSRRIVEEIPDGHCGFWVIVRQLWSELGIGDMSSRYWFGASGVDKIVVLKKSHAYLARNLSAHAATIADVFVEEAKRADMRPMHQNYIEGVETDDEDEYAEPGPTAVRSIKKLDKLKERLVLEMTNRAESHLSERVATETLPSDLWFGGLNFLDARAIAIDAKINWFWLTTEKTSAFVISPSGYVTNAEISTLQPGAADVISIWNGKDHFTSVCKCSGIKRPVVTIKAGTSGNSSSTKDPKRLEEEGNKATEEPPQKKPKTAQKYEAKKTVPTKKPAKPKKTPAKPTQTPAKRLPSKLARITSSIKDAFKTSTARGASNSDKGAF